MNLVGLLSSYKW